MSKFVTYKSY